MRRSIAFHMLGLLSVSLLLTGCVVSTSNGPGNGPGLSLGSLGSLGSHQSAQAGKGLWASFNFDVDCGCRGECQSSLAGPVEATVPEPAPAPTPDTIIIDPALKPTVGKGSPKLQESFDAGWGAELNRRVSSRIHRTRSGIERRASAPVIVASHENELQIPEQAPIEMISASPAADRFGAVLGERVAVRDNRVVLRARPARNVYKQRPHYLDAAIPRAADLETKLSSRFGVPGGGQPSLREVENYQEQIDQLVYRIDKIKAQMESQAGQLRSVDLSPEIAAPVSTEPKVGATLVSTKKAMASESPLMLKAYTYPSASDSRRPMVKLLNVGAAEGEEGADSVGSDGQTPDSVEGDSIEAGSLKPGVSEPARIEDSEYVTRLQAKQRIAPKVR